MHLYQIKIGIEQDKVDEFTKNLNSIWFEFLKEEGCLNFQIYQEIEDKNSFCLIGEFDTHDAMMNHFRTNYFGILIGASSVLGKSFKINISEIMETGGLELAKSINKKEQ
jgi:quinol monooxygenase YgiN